MVSPLFCNTPSFPAQTSTLSVFLETKESSMCPCLGLACIQAALCRLAIQNIVLVVV